jgi:hypothetical protein
VVLFIRLQRSDCQLGGRPQISVGIFRSVDRAMHHACRFPLLSQASRSNMAIDNWVHLFPSRLNVLAILIRVTDQVYIKKRNITLIKANNKIEATAAGERSFVT